MVAALLIFQTPVFAMSLKTDLSKVGGIGRICEPGQKTLDLVGCLSSRPTEKLSSDRCDASGLPFAKNFFAKDLDDFLPVFAGPIHGKFGHDGTCRCEVNACTLHPSESHFVSQCRG